MKVLLPAGLLALGLLSAEHAVACAPVYLVVPPVAGETEDEMLARSRAVEQDQYRAQSDSIFIAEVSMERVVEADSVQIFYSPLHLIEGRALPEQTLVIVDARSTCRRAERVGEPIIIFASLEADDWTIVARLRPEQVVDPSLRPLIFSALHSRR
ncbi:hypothetical protein Q0812_03185 [Brevundimonas sp. 2R-24]|uniref:Uncharacterized protein n=1 Tax=Peiella sedimenti TaxID=3061083 RepID=A0ABT8SIS1_9CAUL|nr:hypothetical protein [Caulobacteraceae bacterium XZ-24]